MLLIRGAELDAVGGMDVRCRDGRVVEIGQGLSPAAGEDTIEANGGALLPGLHDHHLHLYALAAARQSVDCGPPQVTHLEALRGALRGAPGDGWIRGVGYHESVAGMLDRRQLDALVDDRPVRIQHRSGKMWFINSAAASLLDLDDSDGQLYRQDDWLRDRIEPPLDLDLQDTSRLLASHGVTGFTDTTSSNDESTAQRFAALGLLQRVVLMGNEQLERGALKIILDDYALPDIDEFRERIVNAHFRDRPVAIHCITRTELVFAASVLIEAGTIRGDRIEHAAETDDAAMALVARTGVTVVTQPLLIFERGDQYLVDVDPAEHEHLYRCRGFIDAGVPLGGSTDAPYGQPDPWASMRAAVTRKTASGRVIGAAEALTPEQALALFTSRPDDPGGPPRQIAVGETADLCLLERSWARARRSLGQDPAHATVPSPHPSPHPSMRVAATIVGGGITFREPR